MGSQYGKIFRITTFGESHGHSVGVVIDGCPAGCRISLEHVQAWLDRRRPGQSHLTTSRQEPDQIDCLSGIEDGVALGSPITLLVKNQDHKKQDYEALAKVYRPSHADYTTESKYGVVPSSGGGRASARETIGRVAAAAIAEQVLHQMLPELQIFAWVSAVKDFEFKSEEFSDFSRASIDLSLVRCPDAESSKKMISIIEEAKSRGDSVGGQLTCCIRNAPVGLGEPVFDKLEADLAKAMMSLPASKSFEVGSGLAGTRLFGSEHNDLFVRDGDRVRTITNLSGGIQGGISNGEDIVLRIGFKPVSTIQMPQQSLSRDRETIEFTAQGRHDPCVLPRAVPMVEAMATLVILDHYLRNLGSRLR